MGKKTPKSSLQVSPVEEYGTGVEHKKRFLVSSLRGFADGGHSASRLSSATFAQCHVGRSVCEFRDFCNRLYYAEGKCDCESGWKKMTGLVLPAYI